MSTVGDVSPLTNEVCCYCCRVACQPNGWRPSHCLIASLLSKVTCRCHVCVSSTVQHALQLTLSVTQCHLVSHTDLIAVWLYEQHLLHMARNFFKVLFYLITFTCFVGLGNCRKLGTIDTVRYAIRRSCHSNVRKLFRNEHDFTGYIAKGLLSLTAQRVACDATQRMAIKHASFLLRSVPLGPNCPGTGSSPAKFMRKKRQFGYLNPILGKLGATHDLS